MSIHLSRRRLIGALGAGAGTLVLSGCDRINGSPVVQRVLGLGQSLTMRAQRIVTDRTALAREFAATDMSPVFRTNGNTMPESGAYQTHVASRFADWKLVVDGQVHRPLGCRSTGYGVCPPGPRSPAMTASRDGARSASGPVCR